MASISTTEYDKERGSDRHLFCISIKIASMLQVSTAHTKCIINYHICDMDGRLNVSCGVESTYMPALSAAFRRHMVRSWQLVMRIWDEKSKLNVECGACVSTPEDEVDTWKLFEHSVRRYVGCIKIEFTFGVYSKNVDFVDGR